MNVFESESAKRLYEVILRLENADECRKFFEDICTIKEIQDLSQRLEVALLLDEGNNYLDISKRAKVSTATISRVSRCLNYREGGYRMAIERIKESQNNNE